MGAAQLKEALKFDIEVIKGPHIGLRLSFSQPTVSIGRGPENDIVLANDPRSSRMHAEIKQRDADFVIVNLSQKNFILVNGQNVQTEIVLNGSVITIGDTEIRFLQEVAAASSEKTNASASPLTPSFPISPTLGKPTTRPLPSTPRPTAPSFPTMPPPAMPPQMSHPQPMGYGGGYQAPPQAPSSFGAAAQSDGLLQNPKVRFYGIIAIVGLIGWFVFSPSKKDNKDPNAIRTSAISMQDVANAEKRSQELLTVKKERYDSVQYRRAQENFLKGFRDFQQGQYARAREAFQVVLNLDPDNELAKRYYHLSKIKFDELVKFNMIQGNRYREKRNFRMCQSNYSNVMTMLQNRKDDPSYREAKQFYEECTLNVEGRY